MSTRTRVVATSFQLFGALVLGAALLHLYATVLIRDHVLTRIANPELRTFISSGYLLNHVLVGLFMLPMGFLMWWSAPGLRHGHRWAFVVNLSFSLAILTTPVAIGWLMVGPEFRSPFFSVAAAMMAVTGVASCGLLFWARREYPLPRRTGDAQQGRLSSGPDTH
jgi:hypothetical protein